MGVMSFSKLSLVLLILSGSVAAVFVSDVFGVDDENVAASAVDRAEGAMASAFEAVLDAEDAGATVSGLLDELNIAGGYLAEAYVWLGLGNFDNATRFADLCYYSVEDVRSKAVELRNEAYGLWANDLVVKMIGSIIGVVVVVFLGFVVWRVFKRRYCRRVLGLRPEVVSGES